MALAKRKPDRETPRSLAEQLADTRATVLRLDAMEREVLAATIAAEAKNPGAAETDNTATVRRVAELLLEGVEIFEKPSDANRLLALQERLAAVREALRIARRRLASLTEDRQDEVEREFLPIWRAHLGKVIALVGGMHELALERHALIARWAERTGFRPQPIGANELDEFLGLDPYAPDRIATNTPCGELLAAATLAGVR